MNLTAVLSTLVKEAKVTFTFCGEALEPSKIFAPEGLLPALAQRADKLCLLCFGYGIGAVFTEEEDSLLGLTVQFDDITPQLLRLGYIYDVILDFIAIAEDPNNVALDELIYE